MDLLDGEMEEEKHAGKMLAVEYEDISLLHLKKLHHPPHPEDKCV